MGWKSDLEARRQHYYDRGVYKGRTLADEMRAGAVAHPDARMVFHSETHPAEATLPELQARSHALAGALHALGLRPGDVVAVQVPNWLEGALAFQAAMALGVVVVPIIHIYGPAEVGFILRQSRARALICPDRWRHIDYLARVERLDRSELPDLEHVVVIGEAPAEALSWRELEARASSSFELPPVASDDVCLLVYTSGTTSDPKGVQHTHETLLAEVRDMGLRGGAGPPRSLGAFPAGHIAGVLGFMRLYLHGGTSVLMDTWNANDAAMLVERHGLKTTAGTPFHLTGLLDAAEEAGRDISTLAGYMVGAANVPPSVVARSEAAGVPSYRAYGSSEHPTLTSGHPDHPLEKRSGTDGALSAHNEIRIVDDDGKALPPGEAGEIASRGPELFVGYRDPSLNEEAFLPGGWFLTGDIGVVDGDGYLTITDRKKDVIIRGGENIASKEVEDVLARHPAVSEAAVVGAADEHLGERVCAFVILREDAQLELPEVLAHFEREGLARQKAPERLVEVLELPRTPSGKVKKFELRERLRSL